MRGSIRACAILLLFAAFLVATPRAAAASEPVGKTLFSHGGAMVARAGDVLLLGRGAPIYEKDVITTGRGSYAIVRFNDGSSVTLRPESVFQVRDYAHGAGRESLLLHLFKGGLRAVTGLISRFNPNGFKVGTAVATIGVRGTDFSARLCEGGCAPAEHKLAERGEGAPEVPVTVIGRVALMHGSLRARGADGLEHVLVVGSPLHEHETLSTGRNSFAVLAFRDHGRVSLEANTVFVIVKHHYAPAHPAQSSAFLRLLKGGLRWVSGLIGKARPRAVQIATPVATIGLRGTRFDLVCSGTCAAPAKTALASPRSERFGPGLRAAAARRPAQANGPLNGLFVVVREGSLFADQDGRTLTLRSGVTAFFNSRTGPVRFDLPLPPALRRALPPLPEGVKVPPSLLSLTRHPVGPGLWVAVNSPDGHVQLRLANGKELDVGQGETGVVHGGKVQRVRTPTFITRDRYNINPAGKLNLNKLPRGPLPPVCQ